MMKVLKRLLNRPICVLFGSTSGPSFEHEPIHHHVINEVMVGHKQNVLTAEGLPV